MKKVAKISVMLIRVGIFLIGLQLCGLGGMGVAMGITFMAIACCSDGSCW